MDDKVLLKQFNTDSGQAFLEVIRLASAPLDALKIKSRLKTAGAKSADVDERWNRAQRFINAHPHVRKPTSRLYEWSIEPLESAEVLRRLAANTLKSVPAWLTGAFVQILADSLSASESQGPMAQTSWSEQRNLEKAQVLARLVTTVELCVSRGQTSAEILELIQDDAAAKRLERIATVGQRMAFDPTVHDSLGGPVKRGAVVEIVSSGYRWFGGETPTTVVRAGVRPI